MTLPRTLSQKAFAELLAIHENTASNLRRAGVLVLSSDRRKLLLAESLRAYIDYVGNGREADLTLAQAHKQLIELQSDKLRLTNGERAGDLLPAAMVQQLQDGLVLQFKAAAEGMPGRHASNFAEPRAYLLLQTAAAEILAQVATWLERSQSPLFTAMAADALEQIRRDGVYAVGDDNAEGSKRAEADRTAAGDERSRRGGRIPKQDALGPKVSGTSRATAHSNTKRRR